MGKPMLMIKPDRMTKAMQVHMAPFEQQQRQQRQPVLGFLI
jgi:hypothetical protein